jgi:hypothetical protein
MNFQDLINLYNSSSLTEADLDRYEYEQFKDEWFHPKSRVSEEVIPDKQETSIRGHKSRRNK